MGVERTPAIRGPADAIDLFRTGHSRTSATILLYERSISPSMGATLSAEP